MGGGGHGGGGLGLTLLVLDELRVGNLSVCFFFILVLFFFPLFLPVSRHEGRHLPAATQHR